MTSDSLVGEPATARIGDDTFGELDADGVAGLVHRLDAAGRPLGPVARAAGLERSAVVAAAALRLAPDLGDRLLEAAWPELDRRATLAAASRVATRLAVDRALVWSSRLRAEGLAHFCPLVACGEDVARPPSARVRCAAAAWRAFADPRGRAAALDAASELAGDAARSASLAELALLAPDVAEEVRAASLREALSRPRTAAASLECGASIVVSAAPGGPSPEEIRALIGEVTAPSNYEIAVLVAGGSAIASEHELAGPGRGVVIAARDRDEARRRASSWSSGEYLVLLDARLTPAGGWLEAIYEAFEAGPDLAAVVPAVHDVTTGEWTCGVELVLDCRYEPTFHIEPRSLGPRDAPGGGEPELLGASGEAVAFRRDLYERLGGADAALPEPYATVDLCLRAGSLGWRVGPAQRSVLRRARATGADAAGARDRVPAEFDERWIGAAGPDRVVGFAGRTGAGGESR
ncbi:MAG TPA: glycosyltransferase [Acidimicrobiales bacterium]|nr:glycosyltransferase [Acidimicrobiales bacterium]